MSSEAKLWEEMRDNIGHLGHFSRVESGATSAGIPDVDYCLNMGHEGHIELKYANLRMCKGKIMKLKKNFIRPTQVKWFRDRAKAGSNSNWLLAKFVLYEEVVYLLFDGFHIEKLARTRDPQEWRLMAHSIWRDRMDWQELIQVIKRERL
jgi:hypothetical protein